MTRRKPPNVPGETWIERQIREAERKGEFENLPGAGKPIEGLDRPHDPYWWAKKLLERENISLTPITLQIRKAVEAALDEVDRQDSEAEVRAIVDEINRKIRDVNANAASGPPSIVAPLDPDAIVARWRRTREKKD